VLRSGAVGAAAFVEAGASSDEPLQAVQWTIITRLVKLPTRRGVLVEVMGQTRLAERDAEAEEARTLRPLRAAAATSQSAPGQWPGPSPGTNRPLGCGCPGSA
jgi:hypothetical protein